MSIKKQVDSLCARLGVPITEGTLPTRVSACLEALKLTGLGGLPLVAQLGACRQALDARAVLSFQNVSPPAGPVLPPQNI